jgi:hypothetical protein
MVDLHLLGLAKRVRILQVVSMQKVEPLTTEPIQVLISKLHNLKEVLEKDHSVQGCQELKALQQNLMVNQQGKP